MHEIFKLNELFSADNICDLNLMREGLIALAWQHYYIHKTKKSLDMPEKAVRHLINTSEQWYKDESDEAKMILKC